MQDSAPSLERDSLQSSGVWEIDNGWHVFGSDGGKIGDVDAVYPHYLVVGRGLIFHSERYIPVSAIANVERDSVFLNVSAKDIDDLGWDRMPEDAVSVREPANLDALVDVDDSYPDSMHASGRLDVPLVEDTIDVSTHSVDRGSVQFQKSVVADTETFDIPLHEENLHVVRHRVERGDGDDELPAGAFQEMEIAIPIRGEEIEVHKRPVVREEVVISKVVRERSQRITETLRREKLHVDGGRGSSGRVDDSDDDRRRANTDDHDRGGRMS